MFLGEPSADTYKINTVSNKLFRSRLKTVSSNTKGNETPFKQPWGCCSLWNSFCRCHSVKINCKASNCTRKCFKTGVFKTQTLISGASIFLSWTRFSYRLVTAAMCTCNFREGLGSQLHWNWSFLCIVSGGRKKASKSVQFRVSLALQCRFKELRAIVEKIRPRKIHASSWEAVYHCCFALII